MRIFKKFDIEKLREFASANRTILALAVVVMGLTTIFLVSRNEDSKVVYNDISQPDYSNGKILAPGSDIYQKKEKVLSTKIEELEKQVQALSEQMNLQQTTKEDPSLIPTEPVSSPLLPDQAPVLPQQPELSPSPIIYTEPNHNLSTRREPSYPSMNSEITAPATGYMPTERIVSEAGPAIISFPIKARVERTELTVKIPSGSFVKAKLLTGVEAPEGKALPVLLQADYAFIGPNKSKIDLSGCFLIAKSTGNLSIERVEMQASKISCVSKTGKMFERELNGFIADNKDNSFAVIGDVNSKQDRVASMAFLTSIVAGISGAISQAQTTSQTNGIGASSSSVTGDETKYIAAGGASNAASVVTQWYLKHAQSLLPTINVGSGQDVWIIVQDAVELPNWYFKKQEKYAGEFNFLSRFAD